MRNNFLLSAFVFVLQIILVSAYPYMIVPDYTLPSSRHAVKRAFDRMDNADFFISKRSTFDRMDNNNFGLVKRFLVKRAFDRMDNADFGLRRKRAFDRITRSDFDLRVKRSFDRMGGTEFGLMKRSVPDVANARENLISALATSIDDLRKVRSVPELVVEERK